MSIEAYFDAGMVLGLLVGCLTFIAAYVYCAYAYGAGFIGVPGSNRMQGPMVPPNYRFLLAMCGTE
jgi:hypothetical protein